LAQHGGYGCSLALAPDGDLFASGGGDPDTEGGCDILLSRLSKRDEILTLKGHHGPVRAMGFSPDSRFLATAGGAGDGSICFWSTKSGVLLERAAISRSALTDLVYVPSGKRVLVVTRGDVVLWNIFEHKVDRNLGVNGCASIAVSPCGQYIALGHENGTVRSLARGSEKLLWQSDGHRGPVTSLTFSPDGRRLISTGMDASAIIWQA
jgi:WD40 repeat protein